MAIFLILISNLYACDDFNFLDEIPQEDRIEIQREEIPEPRTEIVICDYYSWGYDCLPADRWQSGSNMDLKSK